MHIYAYVLERFWVIPAYVLEEKSLFSAYVLEILIIYTLIIQLDTEVWGVAHKITKHRGSFNIPIIMFFSILISA